MSEIANLERLIGRIDAMIAALPVRGDHYDYDQWQRYRDAAQDTFQRLLAEENGRTRPNDVSVIHLKLAGIATSSTSGPTHAMRNWQTAARRRIAKLMEQAR